ncbi:unnamed protein product [Diamesa hyperborea]
MMKSISQNFSKLTLRLASTNGQKADDEIVKPLHNVETNFEKATFGMGCFWSGDSLFGGQHGVLRTRVGYSGGKTSNPTYRNIGDHTEVIDIDFDPISITFKDLLKLFWNNHEYGLTRKQKRQYASLIFYHSVEQQEIAEQSRKEEIENRRNETIYTEIIEASQFYAAEDYHQKYRLQGHKNLAKEIGLSSKLLQTSHVASKLNGYLVGIVSTQQYLEEVKDLGLTQAQIDYVKRYVIENQGGGLSC